jgi:hypothetical protein
MNLKYLTLSKKGSRIQENILYDFIYINGKRKKVTLGSVACFNHIYDCLGWGDKGRA